MPWRAGFVSPIHADLAESRLNPYDETSFRNERGSKRPLSCGFPERPIIPQGPNRRFLKQRRDVRDMSTKIQRNATAMPEMLKRRHMLTKSPVNVG